LLELKVTMADSFSEYPPNMAPQDSLVVREHAEPDHAVVPYSGEDLSRPTFGPLNPFKDQSKTLKRKNVLTGSAEETFISEHTFRSKHRAVEAGGGPEREFRSGADVKEEAARIRAGRQRKGDATIADGNGAYVGPWAAYKKPEWEEVGQDEELASDEEVEYVYEDDEDDVVESGAVVSAPAAALARRKEVEELGDETTIFHGSEEFDYQGRT
jgi:pre-mRNA-processing factor 17